MIKTSFIEDFDFETEIPAGSRVGILGCSHCASVYKTGDTDRIESVAERIHGHCEVIVTASVDSPCDQRVLKYLVKSIPRFDEAGVFVVLACEAGARSLAALVGGRKILCPVRTEDFCVISARGQSHTACLFCETCSFPDRIFPCPVAACPLHRVDGPCQTRKSGSCVIDETMRCSRLLDAEDAGAFSYTAQPEGLPDKPMAIVPAPGDIASVANFEKLAEKYPVILVAGHERGIDPLVVIRMLAGTRMRFGLALGGLTEREYKVKALTAAELGVDYVFIRDLPEGKPTAAACSTIEAVRAVRTPGDKLTVIVENCFLHQSDINLLYRQLSAGASFVVDWHGASGSLASARELSSIIIEGGKAVFDLAERPFQ